ncbi:MAG TPA: 3-phosphoshikimate 1-carboxyvinyltransferase [Acidimicrobiia bacterium]|nr:3-phosphoshikimate 1-carboxyvinyltransferase [Acidimicrobiia bacterium]
MQYPDQLGIEPRRQPVEAVVRPPGSKSFTNRALVTAGLAAGVSHLHDPLEADDTGVMRNGLRDLGVSIDDNDDPWLVLGSGGALLPPIAPIDAGLSGTTARFLLAVASLVPGEVTVTGRGRLLERPHRELFDALRAAGVEVVSTDQRLPATVHGHGYLPGGKIRVDPTRSSQFVTALLLVAPLAQSQVEIALTGPAVSRSYLTSTLEVMAAFGAIVEEDEDWFRVAPGGYRSAHYHIEADASAAAYPLVAAAITGGTIGVEGIPATSTQPDLAIVGVLEAMGCSARRTAHRLDLMAPARLQPVDVDMNIAPDAVLALAVACLFADGSSRIRNVGNLRYKESDRLAALVTEISRVGASARVEGDDLVVIPGPLHPAIIDTYDDHRMAMAFAVLGLRQPGIVIDRPGVVTKTWPAFFDMLGQL